MGAGRPVDEGYSKARVRIPDVGASKVLALCFGRERCSGARPDGFWKDSILFEKLILDYDTYNPDKSLECHVVLQMPTISSDYVGNFAKELETRYNGYVQTTRELIEILG